VKRIRRLLYPKTPNSAWAPVLAGVILIATAAVAMTLVPQTQQGFSTTPRPHRTAESNPYQDWLEGPVSYIISPRERAAFEKLATGEERDMFIQQFWERRNPTPGSKTNAFKEEFYRRVEHADKYFRLASGQPGWKSDRGHMLLAYGPPDEIQFHPNATPYPFSVWKYQHLGRLGDNVTFRFVDHAGNGDYRLASPPWK
jgi:GWxTD domain-containing protein